MFNLIEYLFVVNINHFWKLFILLKCNIFRNKSVIFFTIILIVNCFYIKLTNATVFSNSLHQCQKLCQEKNLAFPLPHASLGWPNISKSNCDFDCLIDACRLGCKDLDSHDSSCSNRCDPIAGSFACNQGCRAITDIFLHKIQNLIDLSSVELFLDKSLGLGMNWSFPQAQSNLLKEISTTNIQWIAQSRPGGKQGWRWTKLDKNAFEDDSLISTVSVPFEAYYIDVELRLAANWRDNIIISSKHFRLSTFPEKQVLPSYIPQPSSGIYLQLSLSSFVVCWNTESLNKFKIKLFTTKEGELDHLIVSEIISSKCHVFRNLTINEGTEFRLAITDLGGIVENWDEEENNNKKLLQLKNENVNLISEKSLQINISMEMMEEPKKSHPVLLFSDGSSLFLLHDLNDFILLNEPIKVLFTLNGSQAISALCALSQTEILVGLSDGAIFHLEILFEFGIEFDLINKTIEGELKTQTKKLREADGVSITQIVVDFIQEYFYAIRDKIGIVRCKIKTCDNTSTTMMLTITPNFVQRLACDPWNGFLYYTTNVGDIFSMPLFPIDASQNISQTITRRVSEIPAANTVEVDITDQKLFVVTKSGHLMSRDLVDSTIKDEREGWTLNDRYRNVIRSQFYHNRLFWISTSCGDSHPWESCLFSEEFEYQHKTIHLNKYLFTGPVRAFTLLKHFPTLPFLLPPSKVGLILVDMEAFISWKPPTFLPYQASGSSWRSLTYEYILQSVRDDISNNLDIINSMNDLDNNSTELNNNNITENIIKIYARGFTQKTYSSNIQLETNNINYYIAKVRVCIVNNNKICSAQVIAKSHTIQITEAHKQISLLIKRISLSSATDLSLHSVNQFGQSLTNINALDWQGREIAEEQRIFYPQIPSEPGIAIAFDNTSNVLLSSSRKDASITQRFDSNNIRFLDSAYINQILLISSKAIVLFATAYSVNVYRTTSSFDKIIYNCAVGGEDCGEVIGIAFDDGTNGQEGQRILLLVQLSSGTVQLLQSSSDLNQPFQLVHSVSNGLPYRIRQISGFVDGRFLILTEDGYFGTLDFDLTNVNLNFAIRDINHLLVADNVSPFERRFLHFDGPIHFDEKTAQLRWSVIKEGGEGDLSSDSNTSGNTELLPLLFKLSLFRDGFSDNDPTLIVSQESSFSLPPKLLQAWNSRQRFDAQVEAISPWIHAWANQTGLNAATKPPTAPEDIRIYATQQRTVDGSRAIIDLFWHEPSEWNGEKLGYQLNCTITQETTTSTSSSIQSSDSTNTNNYPLQYMNITLKSTQRSFSFTVRSGKVGCFVFAINDQQLVGQPSVLAEIDGSEFKPLIRLFAIDSMESLVAIQNWTIEVSKNGANIRKLRHLTAKNRRRQTTQIGQQQTPQQQQQIFHSSQYQAITFVGNELYAIRKETEMLSSSSSSSQLFLVKLDINQVDQVIYKASLIGDSVQQQIDAMASDWVSNRLLLVGNRALMQIQLDQLQQDSATTLSPKRLFQLSMGAQDAKQLIFDPFTNTALLLTKNGSLLALNLNNGTETNLELTTGCLRQKTITSIVGEFIWNRPSSPQLYALTWNGLIELKIGSDNCPEVNVNWDMFGERGLKAISLFAVADKVFVFATPTDLLVYDRLSALVSQFPIPNPPLRQLLTVSQSSQPFPDRNCFKLPSISSVDFIIKNDGRTGAVIELPEPKREENNEVFKQSIECQNISQPQTQYELHFRKRGVEKEKIIRTTNNKTFIDQGVLDKNTDYDVFIGWSNRFWPVQGQSESKVFHTGFGYPSAPRDPIAFSLSPDTVLLSWLPPELLNAPASEIRYRISQQSSSLISPVAVAVRPQEGARGHFSNPTAEVVSCDDSNICQAKVPNLRPSTDYHFWILALHVSRISLNTVEDPEATSIETQSHTRETPGTLRLENATSTSLNIRWNTLPGAENGFPSVQHIQISIQYRQSGVDATWTLLYNSTFIIEPNITLTGSQHSFCIDELRPATTYDYRYLAEYYNIIVLNENSNNKEKILINEFFFQQVQQARTKAGTPSAPTNVQLINEKGTWTLKWSAPDSDGGETIQNYAVEYRPNSQSEWEISDRGLPSDRLFWHVTWSESHVRHEPSDAELTQFRVRAANSEGFGDFGYTKVKGADSDNSLERNGKSILWNVLLVLLLILLLLCAGAYYTLRSKMTKRRKVREKLHKPICMESIGEQIQQFHQTQMQFSPEVQNELKILPKILPSRVKISKQLGIGSFGRVCEGFMRLDRDVSVRVAVKYLKDNSAENRIKFLKEAILMNNFDHPNIVKLLGVNMEQGEHFLILELMDGGDLLGFLREYRPKKGNSSRLCLRDLIAIAVDIGRGCVHLETYKHVHRDLAARNCLISSKTSPQRVTKIADFGLARSLFVDDYYRVHGQDMLPLRWLSPEVITQGLFTSKSDVWAFGVLLWEIITLGEQPYSNRQNTEVLNLLSNGICLERPLECPEELYQVMKSCWTIPAEQRPKFLELQPKMESIRGLTHFQSRDPFPSGLLNGFENSLDSSTSTHESSTTTNGGDSSTAHFEKSENSSSRKHSRFGPKAARRQLGQQQGTNCTISTTTTNVAFNDSADYELPIRPSTSIIQSSLYNNNNQQTQNSPFSTSQFRKVDNNNTQQQQPLQKGVVAFQNNAFMIDEDLTTSERLQEQRQQFWNSQNHRQISNNNNNNGNINNNRHSNINEELENQPKLSASSNRVSRV